VCSESQTSQLLNEECVHDVEQSDCCSRLHYAVFVSVGRKCRLRGWWCAVV